MRLHTYVRTYVHTYIRTYTHTYIHTCLLCRATSQTLSDAWYAALVDGSGRTGWWPGQSEARERSNEKTERLRQPRVCNINCYCPKLPFQEAEGEARNSLSATCKVQNGAITDECAAKCVGFTSCAGRRPLDSEAIRTRRSSASTRDALPKSRRRSTFSATRGWR